MVNGQGQSFLHIAVEHNYTGQIVNWLGKLPLGITRALLFLKDRSGDTVLLRIARLKPLEPMCHMMKFIQDHIPEKRVCLLGTKLMSNCVLIISIISQLLEYLWHMED